MQPTKSFAIKRASFTAGALEGTLPASQPKPPRETHARTEVRTRKAKERGNYSTSHRHDDACSQPRASQKTTAGALEGTLPASQPKTLQKISTASFNGGL